MTSLAGTSAVLIFGTALGRTSRFISAAARRGHRVLVIDTPETETDRIQCLAVAEEDDPMLLVDAWLHLDPAEPAVSAVSAARAWVATGYRIVAVCNTREEYVEHAHSVAIEYGLPTVGATAANICRNKASQRTLLAEWSPAHAIVPRARDEWRSTSIPPFPIVVKATNLCGGQGIRAVHSEAELLAHLESCQADATLLFEELVPGREYSVESLVRDGELLFTNVTEKDGYTEDGRFVERTNTVPAPICDGLRDDLLSTNKAILERLEFESGMSHAEFKIGLDGRPKLMEIAARRPGLAIMALYLLTTNEPLEESLIAVTLGESTSYPSIRGVAREVAFPAPRAGVLRDVVSRITRVYWCPEEGPWPEPEARDGDVATVTLMCTKQRGAHVKPPAEDNDIVGVLLIAGETYDEVNAMEERVLADLQIIVEDAPACPGS